MYFVARSNAGERSQALVEALQHIRTRVPVHGRLLKEEDAFNPSPDEIVIEFRDDVRQNHFHCKKNDRVVLVGPNCNTPEAFVNCIHGVVERFRSKQQVEIAPPRNHPKLSLSATGVGSFVTIPLVTT